jgi:2-hydroxycyclohexanecarboxyl-CoA dehydrogenase
MGRSIAERMSKEGHDVAVLDIDGDLADEVAMEIQGRGGKAISVKLDVSDRADVDKAMNTVRSELGPIGILITSAAISRHEPFMELSLESWNRVLAVNLRGTFNCVQSAIPDMLEAKWGRVVLISSSSPQRGAPRMAHYASSKGGILALSKSLGLEFAAQGITVNNIAPSSIDTPMYRRSRSLGALPPPEVAAQNMPVKRLGTGEDIAAAAAYLVSKEASYVTGQTLSVNGGSYTT